MGKREKGKKRLSLDDFVQFLRESFNEGYTKGAIDVANGAMVVEKTDKGYRLTAKEDKSVSAGATR